jgi:HlyD family secretion protein
MAKIDLGPSLRRPSPLARFLWIIPVAGMVALAWWLMSPAAGEEEVAAQRNTPIYVVERGPLTISVLSSGTISSAEAAIIKSEVEGRTTILSIVAEGKDVKAGDLLVELDSSALQDRRIDQEITVQNQDASFVQAREALEVARKQAEADIAAAKVAHDLAVLDLQKYTEGEFKQQYQAGQNKITLADAELQRARDKFAWSQKLFTEGYITQSELEADRLSEQKSRLDLELARGELQLLEKFTQQRQLAQLSSDVEQKKFLLTKAHHKATSSIIEAEAVLRSRETQLRREREKLEKIIDQIAKCRIVAPVDGMVVYATTGGGGSMRRNDVPPLTEGSEVQERQELIRMPIAGGMKAEIKIHESMLQKVAIDLPVIVKTEALPGREFYGNVTRISLLPDAQSAWMNPDLKVYTTDIIIHGEVDALRPGMSCSAEIIVDHFDDAVHVPIQAVLRVGGKPTVYLASAGEPTPLEVQIGLDNNRMVQILGGLKGGERILLAPPLPPASVRDTVLSEAGLNGMTRPRPHVDAPASDDPAPKQGAAPKSTGASPTGKGPKAVGQGSVETPRPKRTDPAASDRPDRPARPPADKPS